MPPASPAVESKTVITPEIQLLMVRYSRCGTILAGAGMDGRVHRWSLTGATPTAMKPLMGHDGWVNALAVHPNKLKPLVVSGDSWGRLLAWDPLAVEPTRRWDIPSAHSAAVRKIAVSPDGSTVASVSRDGLIRLAAIDTGAKIRDWSAGDDLLALAFHPGGTLITGDLHGKIQTWDPKTGKSIKTFDAAEMYLLDRIQDVGGVRCFAFDEKGSTIFAGGAIPKTGGFVQAIPLLLSFDWATGKRGPSWKGATDAEGLVHDIAWHGSGGVFGVTSGQPGQGRLFLWKPGEATPGFTASKPNCHSLDLHPNGKRVVVAATNANSSGNGRVKDKAGGYPANVSPLYFWDLA